MVEIFSALEVMKEYFFLVGYITSYQAFPEPLSPEEEEKYLAQYVSGDEKAKKILIERNLRLVAHIAKKYANTNVEQEDIISIGTIGLIKAINSYQEGKGVKLGTYAARCIENGIFACWKTLNKGKFFRIGFKAKYTKLFQKK